MIIKKFINSSIRVKILFILMLISTLSLVLSFSIFIAYDFFSFQSKNIEDLKQYASLVGNQNEVTVRFNQPPSAKDDLFKLLSKDDKIIYGSFFVNDTIFAYYDRTVLPDTVLNLENIATYIFNDSLALPESSFKPVYQQSGSNFKLFQNYFEVYVPIEDENGYLFTVYLRSDLSALYERYIRYAGVLISISFVTLIIAFLLSLNLQKLISKPVLALANTTNEISKKKDYSIRIEQKRKDEIGTLINGFNQMLSEIEQQNENLIQAKDIAEHSAKAKEEFLANMSHEIRTPMNAIMGVVDFLNDTSLNDKQQNYLDIIKNSADNLLVIINDILDLSKIESGKLVFEEAVIKPASIINTIIESCRPRFEKKKLEIKIDLDPRTPENFIGDPVRFGQILLNLFTNAIKFTIKGSITIGSKFIIDDYDTVTLKFYVKDTGIGIPREKFEVIFSSFTQATNATTRKYGGTGLGLSISQRLVEMQNGKMDLESEVGKGSTFSFEVTFKKTTQQHLDKDVPTPVEDIRINKANSSKSILLAEDNEVNQMLVVTLLNQWDYKVDVAENGIEAIEKLKSNNYDLILMDVHMPEMDGYDATKSIRKDLNGIKSEVPIIAMTASALQGEAERCLEAGMDDYISKPFNKNILYEKIVRFTAVED